MLVTLDLQSTGPGYEYRRNKEIFEDHMYKITVKENIMMPAHIGEVICVKPTPTGPA